MWICLNNSFMSIVQSRNNKDKLLVRSRKQGHIEAVFHDAKTFIDVDADYHYRAFISKDLVSTVISNNIFEIDYDNFKNSVKNDQLHDMYSDIWLITNRYQAENERHIDIFNNGG